jgi:hypothetical protein
MQAETDAEIDAAVQDLCKAYKDVQTGQQLRKSWRSLIDRYVAKVAQPDHTNFPVWVRAKLKNDNMILQCLMSEFSIGTLDELYAQREASLTHRLSVLFGFEEPRLLACGLAPTRSATQVSRRYGNWFTRWRA